MTDDDDYIDWDWLDQQQEVVTCEYCGITHFKGEVCSDYPDKTAIFRDTCKYYPEDGMYNQA